MDLSPARLGERPHREITAGRKNPLENTRAMRSPSPHVAMGCEFGVGKQFSWPYTFPVINHGIPSTGHSGLTGSDGDFLGRPGFLGCAGAREGFAPLTPKPRGVFSTSCCSRCDFGQGVQRAGCHLAWERTERGKPHRGRVTVTPTLG